MNPSSEAVQPGRVAEPIRVSRLLLFRGGGWWGSTLGVSAVSICFGLAPLARSYVKHFHTSIVAQPSSIFVQPSEFVAFRHSHSTMSTRLKGRRLDLARACFGGRGRDAGRGGATSRGRER
eukprot:6073231-Prymnesium_polylepis.1